MQVSGDFEQVTQTKREEDPFSLNNMRTKLYYNFILHKDLFIKLGKDTMQSGILAITKLIRISKQHGFENKKNCLDLQGKQIIFVSKITKNAKFHSVSHSESVTHGTYKFSTFFLTSSEFSRLSLGKFCTLKRYDEERVTSQKAVLAFSVAPTTLLWLKIFQRSFQRVRFAQEPSPREPFLLVALQTFFSWVHL